MAGFFFAQEMAEKYATRFKALFVGRSNLAKISKLSREAQRDIQEKQNRMKRFGFWYGSQVQLAESGIFGTMDKVLKTNAIDALTALFYLNERE